MPCTSRLITNHQYSRQLSSRRANFIPFNGGRHRLHLLTYILFILRELLQSGRWDFSYYRGYLLLSICHYHFRLCGLTTLLCGNLTRDCFLSPRSYTSVVFMFFFHTSSPHLFPHPLIATLLSRPLGQFLHGHAHSVPLHATHINHITTIQEFIWLNYSH